jgi:hypothetical protein
MIGPVVEPLVDTARKSSDTSASKDYTRYDITLPSAWLGAAIVLLAVGGLATGVTGSRCRRSTRCCRPSNDHDDDARSRDAGVRPRAGDSHTAREPFSAAVRQGV